CEAAQPPWQSMGSRPKETSGWTATLACGRLAMTKERTETHRAPVRANPGSARFFVPSLHSEYAMQPDQVSAARGAPGVQEADGAGLGARGAFRGGGGDLYQRPRLQIVEARVRHGVAREVKLRRAFDLDEAVVLLRKEPRDLTGIHRAFMDLHVLAE